MPRWLVFLQPLGFLIFMTAGIAETNRAAYWDFRAGMGGEASIFKFNKEKLASADLVHLTPTGGAYMGGIRSVPSRVGMPVPMTASPAAAS